MRRVIEIAVIIIISLHWSGCGYRLLLASGEAPVELAVPMVQNRSPFQGMAAPLTGALRTRLKSYGVDVTSSTSNAARLTVVIVDVSSSAGMLGAQGGRLVPIDVEWKIEADISITDPSGDEVLSSRTIGVTGRAVASGGMMGEEAAGEMARSQLLDALAKKISLVVVEQLLK